MVDVTVSTQLQQWSFDKPSEVRPGRSDSAASSPDLYDQDTVRIDTSAVEGSKDLDSKETLFQERYLSSEEDLSPMEADSDDGSMHEMEEQVFSVKRMSIARFDKGQSCDTAVLVSYVSAGRPKVIEVPNPSTSPIREKIGQAERTERTERAASIALPAQTMRLRLADRASRLSLALTSRSRSSSPAVSRRPSVSKASSTKEQSPLRATDSSSSLTNSSTKSTTSPTSENLVHPPTAAAAPLPRPVSRTSSLYITTIRSPSTPFPSLMTPTSPEPHTFLSSDPYENSTTSAASPIIKSAPHRRLRSISQKLSLARIAISPTTKKWDSRVNGRPAMPPTPGSATIPTTPMSAPLTSSSSPKAKLRRNSRLVPRGANEREPPLEMPTMPQSAVERPSSRRMTKLVPRGADERAPPLELPPFPDDESSDAVSSVKTRTVRKRKSLMDFNQIKKLM
ncbi:hypothetical protein GQ43DRAFT_447997 [Delitschia confertaspora ATCC 74209]|uniref:Uncharacterized protein n=1 Tax=Delitschia confertaspora ATCC 74209 TaxID=1513339 RepID=A0A9P4MR64_9PLEO|nr:hypothetical protein GQ43DRAFT_447997 [Delitschia confertaspora ATCC 74209]